MKRSFSLLLVQFGIVVQLGSLHVAKAAEDGEAFFERKIRPILVMHCYECHSDVNSEGGLQLDTRPGWKNGGDSGAAIVPGKPDDSLLINAVRYQDENLKMPPEVAGGKLNAEEIAALEEWVRIGAPDPRVAPTKLGGMNAEDAASWWAFQPLPMADAEPSPAKIDALIDRKLEEHFLTPVARADKRTLMRRATYDLTGLPPTPAEVDAFLADESPNAFAKVVDRLLDSPQYGVRWGRHWLDVVRYADTAGENTDRPLPHAWRYRNWVFESFNEDKPFDEFVRLQLAGDLIRSGQPRDQINEGIIATGYLAIARRYGHDIDKQKYLMHEDVIDNLGKNLLGLTTGCSRCHDHKYDAITMEDYYALYGIFESTRFAFPGCEPKGQPRDLVPLLSQAEIDAQMQPWNEQVAIAQAEKEQLEKSAERLKSLLGDSARLIMAKTVVGEGASVPIKNLKITLQKGEVTQLTVFPNGGHGADTTQIQWNIQEDGGERRTWDVEDLIPVISQGNPLAAADGALWCFLESTSGPAFLAQRYDSLPENVSLKAWKRTDDALSIFVNTADQPVKVWTTLPAKAFFVHPEHNRPVTVAFVSPIDGAVTISGAVTDAHPSGLDGVSFEFAHIASSQYGEALVEVGRRASVPTTDPGPKPDIPVAYAVVDSKPVNARLQRRGDPEQLGEEVPRRWLSVFGGDALATPEESGRRELADWIAKHPLTARVMVNRIWHWHFGRGLVATPNNFGSRGEAPSHPELLEWLSAEFVASGYRVKEMHRLIMKTAAYQRSSEQPQRWLEADPENRLLGRFSRRRLSAEEIRDSLLQISGHLDASAAQGHPFPDESTWNFTQHNPFNAVYETNKRSAYLMVQRQRRHPFLALFDGADPNASTPSRQTSTVPTQALYFLNDPFFHAQAAVLADRLSGLDDDNERISQMYRVIFQREPTESERASGRNFLQQYPTKAIESWCAYSRVLLASNEFIHVD
ncbi:MAG: PSD1 domain-containing protein [Planctomycetaceae bacterium]|nr:PSD1 domain-containing protein [Planctomycetaceae bacterium]